MTRDEFIAKMKKRLNDPLYIVYKFHGSEDVNHNARRMNNPPKKLDIQPEEDEIEIDFPQL